MHLPVSLFSKFFEDWSNYELAPTPHTFLVFLEIRQKDQKHKNFRVEII